MKREKEIRELYESGVTRSADIAKAIGLSQNTVGRNMRELGLKPTRYLAERTIRLKQMHSQGMTDAEIAKELGVSRKAAASVRRRNGLPFNGSAPRMIDREYLAREFDEHMKALQSHGEHDEVRRKVKSVAAEIGATYDRVMKIYVEELGLIERRPVRKYTDEQYAEAKRLLDDHGLPYSEVGKMTGIKPSRLGEVFPGRGLSPSEARSMGWVKEKMLQMGI